MKRIFGLIALIALSGCKDAKFIANEVMKSDSQRNAEKACAQTLYQLEPRRTPDMKDFAWMTFETNQLTNSHYLVKASYKVVTMDDPTGESLCSLRQATCDVSGTTIVDVQGSPIPSLCRR